MRCSLAVTMGEVYRSCLEPNERIDGVQDSSVLAIISTRPFMMPPVSRLWHSACNACLTRHSRVILMRTTSVCTVSRRL